MKAWCASICAVLFLCLLCSPRHLPAAEVTNLRPTFTSSQLTLEYDLIGAPGEQFSGVEILLDLHGKRYTSHMLNLSGDFGRSIPVGKKRKIIWRHTKDIPEGLDKSFKCIVNAVSNDAILREELTPSEGIREPHFAVSKLSIVDRQSQLMWSRSGSIAPKPMNHSDAHKALKQFNTERFAGYNDWRMPTREEFETLVTVGKQQGWGSGFTRYISDYLTTCGFIAVQSGNYWTSSESAEQRGFFYAFNTWNGNSRTLESTNYYYLWPVRSLQ